MIGLDKSIATKKLTQSKIRGASRVLAFSTINISNHLQNTKKPKANNLKKLEFKIEPQKLGTIASRISNDIPMKNRVTDVIKEIKAEFPSIEVVEEPKWFLASPNGQAIQYANIYGSNNEFITLVHYPYGSSSFSGRFSSCDVYTAIISGCMKGHLPGEFDPISYTQGNVYELHRGNAKNVEFDRGTLLIDYYRGNSLSIMPFATILPTLFQTGDYIGTWEQIVDSFKLVSNNIKNEIEKK